jgi:hypothetical protein
LSKLPTQDVALASRFLGVCIERKLVLYLLRVKRPILRLNY